MGSGGSKCMAATAAAFVLAGMVASSLLAGRDDDVRERLARFVAEQTGTTSGVRRRTPLHGNAHDGDAMAFYVAADKQWNGASRVMGGWSRPDHDEATREAVWSAIEPIVATLRVAVAAGSAAPARGPRWFDLRDLLQFAQRRAAARADWRDAVLLWLDEQALLRDFGWLPDDRSFAAWTAIELLRLPAAAAATLAAGLTRLDAELARPDDATASLVWVAADALRRAATGRTSLRARLLAWPSGFDPGRHELLGVQELIDALPALQPATASWPQRSRQWQQFVAHLRGVQGRHIAGWAAGQQELECRQRQALARVRLLRLALAFTSRQSLPALADPFADGPLVASCDGDVATFRSAASPRVLELRALRR